MCIQKQPNTALQFSLRSLLAAMSILSVLFAVFAPMVQAQPPGVRQYVLWGVLGLAALAVVGLVVLGVRRWRVETRGGDLLLRPKHAKPWHGCMLWLMLAVVFGGLLAGQCVAMGHLFKGMPGLNQALPGVGIPLMTRLIAITAFAPLTLALVWVFALLWWQVTPMTLEIRENGIGYGGFRFLPWSAVTGYNLMDAKYAVQLTISSAARKHLTVISFGERDEVQRLLDAKWSGS
jgi:hypothetical protein